MARHVQLWAQARASRNHYSLVRPHFYQPFFLPAFCPQMQSPKYWTHFLQFLRINPSFYGQKNSKWYLDCQRLLDIYIHLLIACFKIIFLLKAYLNQIQEGPQPSGLERQYFVLIVVRDPGSNPDKVWQTKYNPY